MGSIVNRFVFIWCFTVVIHFIPGTTFHFLTEPGFFCCVRLVEWVGFLGLVKLHRLLVLLRKAIDIKLLLAKELSVADSVKAGAVFWLYRLSSSPPLIIIGIIRIADEGLNGSR